MLKNRSLRRILYRLELFWLRGPLAQLAFLLVLLLFLAFLGGLAMGVLHPRYAHLGQASWWAFLHLTDTGYLGDDKDPLERTMAVILTFTGALLFVGGVIAILTTWLDRLMTTLSSGRGMVVEEGHLLLLGSNAGLSDLIAECSSAAAQRWPQGRLPTIVVLSEAPVEIELPAAVRKRQRVVLRTGNPADPASLERADYRRARVILLLSSRGRRGPGPSDLNVLKTLVALRGALPGKAPRLVLDLSYATNARLLPSLVGSLSVDVLSSLEFSGRLTCQCIRYPGISKVYRQLLSDALGQSILLLTCPVGLVGRSLGMARRMAHGAVVLGAVSQGQAALLEWDRILLAGDELVLLAPSLSEVKFSSAPPDVLPRFGAASLAGPSIPLRILAVGWSEGLLALVGELRRYQSETFQLNVADSLSPDREQALRGALGPNVLLEVLPLRLRTPEDLRLLPEKPYDRVLLLSSDHQDSATADAETALRYALMLGTRGRFVVELHEESNAPLFGEEHDLVITDQVVNHMLAQISLKPAFSELYEELFTEGGFELRLLTFEQLLNTQDSVTGQAVWQELDRQLFERGFLALGAQTSELTLNPAPDWLFEFTAQTRILVLVRS